MPADNRAEMPARHGGFTSINRFHHLGPRCLTPPFISLRESAGRGGGGKDGGPVRRPIHETLVDARGGSPGFSDAIRSPGGRFREIKGRRRARVFRREEGEVRRQGREAGGEGGGRPGNEPPVTCAASGVVEMSDLSARARRRVSSPVDQAPRCHCSRPTRAGTDAPIAPTLVTSDRAPIARVIAAPKSRRPNPI